jgi:hypothetical protein
VQVEAAGCTGSGGREACVVADAAVLAPIDAAPPDAAIAVVEPPTAESVHVEVGRAMRRWAKDPKDKSLYAKDFGGRAEPDGRVEPIGADAWIASLPASYKVGFSEVKSWLDPNMKLGEGETKTHASFWYDGKDDYREIVWKRESGQQLLLSIKTNSRNSKEEKAWRDWRNYFPLDATSLGKQLTAWVRVEGDLAWLVVANDKFQVVADLWPAAGSACTVVEPAPAGTLAQLRCTGVGDGQDFTVARDKDTVAVRLTPAGKDAPMSTDRRIELTKGAKLAVQPAP